VKNKKNGKIGKKYLPKAKKNDIILRAMKKQR